jgi:hypothetical protein
VLIGPSGNEVMTEIPGWPMLKIEADGQAWQRPAILEIV